MSIQEWMDLFSTFSIPSTTLVFNPGVVTPRVVVHIFGGVASRYFMYTAVLHLLYTSFRWGLWVYSGLL